MRGHVEMCVRTLANFKGRFSDELEAFWRDVERQYKCCNVMMIPQEHIPLWHVRSVDQGILLEAKPHPLSEAAAIPPPADGRSRESRAKAVTAGTS